MEKIFLKWVRTEDGSASLARLPSVSSGWLRIALGTHQNALHPVVMVFHSRVRYMVRMYRRVRVLPITPAVPDLSDFMFLVMYSLLITGMSGLY
jgi:hypothetical protein